MVTMTDTEHLIRQAARELQIAPLEITITDAAEDLKTMQVINTYKAAFRDRHGNSTSVEIKEETPFKAIHEALKVAHKAKNNQT